jgi:tricorn protease
VISTGERRLIDGSAVRLPMRGWYVKVTDKGEELGPAIPDVIVENSVDYKAKGVDEQLKAAVDQLLKDISSRK